MIYEHFSCSLVNVTDIPRNYEEKKYVVFSGSSKKIYIQFGTCFT
jgi:hypothetical protein